MKHTWLPAAVTDPTDLIKIVKANGPYLETTSGLKIYDAISSWWCKPLGHCHPLVQASLSQQLALFEHHIPANAYNAPIEELSTLLVGIFSNMEKVMYAGDGSSAIEIALKLSHEIRIMNKQAARKKFIALAGAYHGETIFTLGVCGLNGYKKTYAGLIPQNHFISEVCYVSSTADPLWHDCNFDYEKYANFFATIQHETSGIIFEPVVQGAAGMQIISKDFLIKLTTLAREFDLHIICDEIMVGLGRLGVFSVSKEILGIEADMVCFAKHLTAGSIPMSAVVITNSIVAQFKRQHRIFPHSHTHSCNALAAAVAVNYLKKLATSDILAQVQAAENKLLKLLRLICQKYSFAHNPRAIGAIAACDLELPPQILAQVFALGISAGIYLRPIGKTLYLMPPLYDILAQIPEISSKLIATMDLINVKSY